MHILHLLFWRLLVLGGVLLDTRSRLFQTFALSGTLERAMLILVLELVQSFFASDSIFLGLSYHK